MVEFQPGSQAPAWKHLTFQHLRIPLTPHLLDLYEVKLQGAQYVTERRHGFHFQ